MTEPKESRPARAPLFGKRTEQLKYSVDPETRKLLEAKARALGYNTLAEYTSDVMTVNGRGLDKVLSLQSERLRAAMEIGPLLGQEDPEA
jgi:hypothetical protein